MLWIPALVFLTWSLPMPFARSAEPLLPEDLKGVAIHDTFVPAGSFSKAGVVHALQGRLVVVHRASGQAFFAGTGDPIYANDELFTLADSRCRIRFLSDDVVNMAPDTRFSVETFLDRPERGEKTSLFRMLKGKAVFYALRLFRYKQTRFKVQTPTAVVGVRGTQFGVHVFGLEGKRTQGSGVRIADSVNGVGAYLAQAGSGNGPRTGTIVACGDGYLDLTDPITGQRITKVNPNEDFNTATGQKTFDPRNRTLTQMTSETEVQEKEDETPAEGKTETGAGGEDVQDETQVTGEDNTATGEPVDFTDITTNVTTQQTGDETETQGSQPNDYPKEHWGYFNGILTRTVPAGGYYYTQNLSNLDIPGTVQGFHDGSPIGTMDVTGGGAQGPAQITALTHDGNTVDMGLPAAVQSWQYGHDSYMVWGGWRQPIAMIDTGTGIEHYFDYRGYYFVGDHTTDAQMSALHGSLGVVNYSGEAWGKHRLQPAGTDMSGSFTAQVNFNTPSITDFDMTVSGGGHSASISNAMGNFNGNSSQFVLDDASGSWHVDGISASLKDARGTLYGDQAQKMGVLWIIREGIGTTNTAWGMCVGNR
jgi:hypothetical protein